MAWMVIFAFLAGWGLLSTLWMIPGLLHERNHSITVIFRQPSQLPDGIIRRWRWLRSMGLADGQLLIVGEPLAETEQRILRRFYPDVEFCSPEALSSRLELECKHFG